MIVYTDGSAGPTNPGPGGFAIIVCDDNGKVIQTIGKRYEDKMVTNNQMEMLAILTAQKLFGKQIPAPIVYSDSSYCVNSLTNWCYGWKAKGWLKSDNKPPENLSIIKEYMSLCEQQYRINLQKVKGHIGIEQNELADKIAKGLIKSDIIL